MRTLERGLKNRLDFTLRQYRNLKELDNNGGLPQGEREAVLGKARKELQRTIALLESINTHNMKELAQKARTDVTSPGEPSKGIPPIEITGLSKLCMDDYIDEDTYHNAMYNDPLLDPEDDADLFANVARMQLVLVRKLKKTLQLSPSKKNHLPA